MEQIQLVMTYENFETGLKKLRGLKNNIGFLMFLAYEINDKTSERLNLPYLLEAFLRIAKEGSVDPLKALYKMPVSTIQNRANFQAFANNDPKKNALYDAIWGFIVFAYLNRCTNMILCSNKEPQTVYDLSYNIYMALSSHYPEPKLKLDPNVSNALYNFKNKYLQLYADQEITPDSEDISAIFDKLIKSSGSKKENVSNIDSPIWQTSLGNLFNAVNKPSDSNNAEATKLLDILRGLLGFIFARVPGTLTGDSFGKKYFKSQGQLDLNMNLKAQELYLELKNLDPARIHLQTAIPPIVYPEHALDIRNQLESLNAKDLEDQINAASVEIEESNEEGNTEVRIADAYIKRKGDKKADKKDDKKADKKDDKKDRKKKPIAGGKQKVRGASFSTDDEDQEQGVSSILLRIGTLTAASAFMLFLLNKSKAKR